MQSNVIQEPKSSAAWSADDAASIVEVLAMLEELAVKLGPASRFSEIWRDWADRLSPTAEMMAATTLRVPAPFARELLADLREPAEELDDEPITDREQLAYEAEIAASVRQWIRELDGEGDRTLIVQNGLGRDWLEDNIRGAMLEGLTGRLEDGSLVERKAVVAALDGWADVMAQLDRTSRGQL